MFKFIHVIIPWKFKITNTPYLEIYAVHYTAGKEFKSFHVTFQIELSKHLFPSVHDMIQNHLCQFTNIRFGLYLFFYTRKSPSSYIGSYHVLKNLKFITEAEYSRGVLFPWSWAFLWCSFLKKSNRKICLLELSLILC